MIVGPSSYCVPYLLLGRGTDSSWGTTNRRGRGERDGGDIVDQCRIKALMARFEPPGPSE